MTHDAAHNVAAMPTLSQYANGETTRPSSVADSVRPVFDGFALDLVDVGPVTLRVRHGVAGAPVFLLHGHPRTPSSAMIAARWSRSARPWITPSA